MFILQSYQTTTLLPNPQWNDSENVLGEVMIKRQLGGGRFTYIKTKDSRRRLVYNFKLSRLKALELRAFVQAYFASDIAWRDHFDDLWIGNFVINPFDFTSTNADIIEISLELEGKKQ